MSIDEATSEKALGNALDRSGPYHEAGYWADRLLIDYFAAAVRKFPDKIAVKDDRFGALTYGELASLVSRLAGALAARGVARGEKFVIALPNWQHVPAFMLALNTIGAVGVHLPISGGAHEFSGVLGITDAKGIVVPAEFRGKDFVDLIESVSGELGNLDVRVTVGSERSDPGWLTFEELLSGAPEFEPDPSAPVSASDLTCVLFTSGSSGDPKGVMHSSNSLGALNTTVAPIYGFGPDDVVFMGAPLGYSAGLAHGPRLAIYLGATLVLQESWNADRALETMAREKAAFTLTTPTLLRDLFDSPLFAEYGEQLCLKMMFCGGTYVPSSLLREAQEKLPGTLTSVIWGMTEGIGVGARPGAPKERVSNFDGVPFLGTELMTLGEDGDETATGEEGELVMRGPQLFLGYYKRPELNAEVSLPDGWFRTGDMAVIDAEGYVKITGRRKELIIRGGANISPAEIEQVLSGDPRIRTLVIVGIPDARLGERVCACVIPGEGGENLELNDIVGIARSRGLAVNKWPERLEIVDSVPMTSAGKLRRAILQEDVRRRIAAAEGGEDT